MNPASAVVVRELPGRESEPAAIDEVFLRRSERPDAGRHTGVPDGTTLPTGDNPALVYLMCRLT